MSLGQNLYSARKNSSLSQESVAEKLGVSRQTISKWETDETLPDINQCKKMSHLHKISLDELVEYDMESKEIEKAIMSISEKVEKKINWTEMWAKKYPVLKEYQKVVDINLYATKIKELLHDLQARYSFNQLDSMLVLKDILAHCWNSKN